ncbi:glutaminase A [Fervidibacillus halotolerans]|uniref:Glutaminase n=1 Tax=Fervidibacillus halotolerans TaxID=2980027 RepID=A0A9E8S1U6_9BACI|nr:glutaminase A [Fervidibacillus halotolerans]WAA13877.1 glutaminase A [Fervidibacillus halotolerans]
MIDEVRSITALGKVANYIPALADGRKTDLAVSVCTIDGQYFQAGTVEKSFTLQSISKVLALAFVLDIKGEEEVFSKVGMEPSGDPYYSISKLEFTNPTKPFNPMINAGALAITSLLPGHSMKKKLENFIDYVSCLTGNRKIEYNEKVAKSEFTTSFLNRSLLYYMKQFGVIEGNVEDIIDLYTKQCAVEIDCLQLARIGAIFSLNGQDPEKRNQLITKRTAKICKAFMVTCGMYNASGEFAIKVGVPAKSGVSGGILAVVPNRFGIGIFGPALDQRGNSIGGWKLLEKMADQFDINIF